MKLPIILRRVVGKSMWPTLNEGEIVVASGLLPVIEGAVVVANINGKDFIKRVNTISEDGIELLGDNIDNSYDSRKFGLVTKHNIKGVAIGYPKLLSAKSQPVQTG